MDPCFYFDEEASEMAREGELRGLGQDWLPLAIEGAVLLLFFAASAIGLLREEHRA